MASTTANSNNVPWWNHLGKHYTSHCTSTSIILLGLVNLQSWCHDDINMSVPHTRRKDKQTVTLAVQKPGPHGIFKPRHGRRGNMIVKRGQCNDTNFIFKNSCECVANKVLLYMPFSHCCGYNLLFISLEARCYHDCVFRLVVRGQHWNQSYPFPDSADNRPTWHL